MAIQLSFLYITLFCFLRQVTCHQNDTDRLALISFKRAIQRDPFGVLSSWNDSLHFCDWYGVSCGRRHPDRVVSLTLSSRRLLGSLSPHIGNLSFLSHVDLQNNSFHGHIPPEIGRLRRLQSLILSNNSFQGNIPANLSSCTNLYTLNLIDNKLVGSIPDELSSLSKLEGLGLAFNNLTSVIPPSLGNLTLLRQLSLGRNELEGQIPEDISRLRNLRLLTISQNSLVGEIPGGLFNISSIEIFSASFNRLHGSIPSNIGFTLPKLIYLQLSCSMFSGALPNSLSNASELVQLALFSNSFSGKFPRDLGMLPKLQSIDVSNNQLQGDLAFITSLTNCSGLQIIDLDVNSFRGIVPSSVANLSKDMMYIALSSNQLHGILPVGLENLINLRFYLFDHNYLSGSVPTDFSMFQRLEMLDLQQNRFTGNIPSSIDNLPMLSNLNMGFNNFSGSIPPSIGSCRNLIELELSHNNLTGSIPKQVIGLSSLAISLNLASNALSGPIPAEVGSLRNLALLNLSDNRFSGKIPGTIQSCLVLEKLLLGGNSFEGDIPEGFRALRGLQELDISRNAFTGRIPDFLSNLDALNYLNISFNHLQGEVPNRGIFRNASAVSLFGNVDLCGGIYDLQLPPCDSPDSDKSSLSLALKITIPIIAAATLLTLSAFFLISHCRKKMFKMKQLSVPPFEQQFLRISYEELFKATNGFSAANIIGSGRHGCVYRGTLEQAEIEVAVKVLDLQQLGASKSFLSECEALRSIRHRNLVKLLSVCSSIDFRGNDFKALIFKFMPNGSLDKWLHPSMKGEDHQETKSGTLPVRQRMKVAIDVATAIDYLHNGNSSTIIHGDLKPSNVLLDDELTAYIGDFGLAKIVSGLSSEAQLLSSNSVAIRGSIGYVAPEYGMGDMVSAEGDVYSYGVLLLELFTGKKPTDESFGDNINLHNFVNRCFPDRVMQVVDPNIVGMEEDEGGSLDECITRVMRIGLACSVPQPSERMNIRDVIHELQASRDYLHEQRGLPGNKKREWTIN